jgi:hypothetical protein
MEVVQINLNQCELAQDLLWLNMTESSCDVSLVSIEVEVVCLALMYRRK